MPEGKREKEERRTGVSKKGGTSEQERADRVCPKGMPQRKDRVCPKESRHRNKEHRCHVTLHWPTNGARPRFPFLVAKGGRTGDLFAVANVPKHQFVIPTVGLQVFGISTEINVRDVTGMAFHDCGAHVRLAVKDVNFVV